MDIWDSMKTAAKPQASPRHSPNLNEGRGFDQLFALSTRSFVRVLLRALGLSGGFLRRSPRANFSLIVKHHERNSGIVPMRDLAVRSASGFARRRSRFTSSERYLALSRKVD